ncbi:MAG: hypothetical protein ACFFF9_08660 [Candidatus Thorarchaeota archaeon]
MSRIHNILSLSVVLILVASLFAPLAVNAAYVWTDNFNDGDYNNWTVLYGTFSATSFELNTFASPGGINTIYHDSLCVYGNWVFELWENETDQDVFFISTDWNTNLTDAYSISLEYGTTSYVKLYIWDGLSSTELDSAVITPEYPGGYHYYNITRSSTGHFDVLRDGILELTADDNTITTSKYFIYSLNGIGAIDNIFVSCDLGSECGTTPCIYIIIIIILVIIVIVLIWRWRPR